MRGKTPHGRLVQLFGGHRAQSRDRGCPQARGERHAACTRLVESGQRPVRAVPEGAAFTDGLVQQSLRERRSHQHAERMRTRRLAEHRDIVRISAEARDVGLHPAQGGQLILQAIIPRGPLPVQLRVGQEAQHPHPVVAAHEDDALLGKPRSIGAGIGRGAELKAAAMDPDHDRPLLIRVLRCGPDVEAQAVLALWRPGRRIVLPCRPAASAELRRIGSGACGGCGACQRRLPTGGAA